MTTYGHARAAFSEVYYSGVELVLEEVGMSNHCTSQRQTGAGHKSGSHHLALQRENKSIRKRHELQTESDEDKNISWHPNMMLTGQYYNTIQMNAICMSGKDISSNLKWK